MKAIRAREKVLRRSSMRTRFRSPANAAIQNSVIARMNALIQLANKRRSPRSRPDEEWNGGEHDSGSDERRDVHDEVWDGHEQHPANEGHECALAPAVDAIARAGGAKD